MCYIRDNGDNSLITLTFMEGIIMKQEDKKQEDVKKTVTTLESILKGKELIQFKAAQKTWQTMPKTALTMLAKMEQVGKALNTLYDKGIEKGLKKDVITDMARKAFTGLNRRERSEYRKLANNGKAIRLFVEFASIKSANPTYLVNAWVKAVKEDNLKEEDITESSFSSYLFTKGIPDPDLLIRTSGEMRLSNFLLWQMAYTEIYVTEILWPDFKREDMIRALIDYQNRERRFGLTSEQLIKTG